MVQKVGGILLKTMNIRFKKDYYYNKKYGKYKYLLVRNLIRF